MKLLLPWIERVLLAAVIILPGPGCVVSRTDAAARPWNKPTKYEISHGWWFRETWINHQGAEPNRDPFP